MNQFYVSIRRIIGLLFVASLVAACSTPISSERSSVETPAEPDWAVVEDALAQYEFTPFTLALVGEAERPEEGFKLDETVATDIAYCRNFAQQGMQSRIGSDFWKRAREYDRKLISRLGELVSDPEQVEWLTWQAEGMYAEAINVARNGDAAAAMTFNFGGHSKACSEYAATLPAID